MKKSLLSPDLEYAVLYAISRGACGLDVVTEDELSKTGKIILRSLAALVADGKPPPFLPTSVGLVATEVLGLPREATRNYLLGMEASVAGSEIKDILTKVRSKQVLVELISEAGSMLGKGTFDVGQLNTVLTSQTVLSDIRPLSEELANGFPDPPTGVTLTSLPSLNDAVGGLFGMWAISGAPEVGKTGLAWQLLLDVGQKVNGIYYDFENGLSALMDRTRQICGGDIDRARRITRNIYYRNSIRTLEADLAAVKPPAVVFIDSVQKLPSSVVHHRESIDRWIHRLENLKHRGYHIVLISEVARTQYNQDAYIGAYKESGEIEYSVDTGIQLLPSMGRGIEVHIVKNRHRPDHGCIATLQRIDGWRFKELTNESVPNRLLA